MITLITLLAFFFIVWSCSGLFSIFDASDPVSRRVIGGIRGLYECVKILAFIYIIIYVS